MMPPARLTGARRSERAPAYGTRTLYLLDTNHDTARARQARAVDKDAFDCRRIRAIPTSTEWPGPASRQGRPDGQFDVKRRARPYCRGTRIPFIEPVNHG
ncbi:hypothetical protein F3J14_06000 [Burkholderia sp. Tr-862]|nr:hypothetical protein [Burkholderia sp. Tr-862]